MVRKPCFSQKYVLCSHLLVNKCNQKTYFGKYTIKNWIDSGEWKINYPNFYNIELDEQKKIEEAVLNSSAGLLLHVWEEVLLLFIDYT